MLASGTRQAPMSNVAKLKKQAAEFELKKQFDKALAVYVKLLDTFDDYPGELDVALFNRVGDLMLRQGNVADAVDYYEKAVDRYADTGFFNNAIALCNKILRHSPGRGSVYYKLGKISAQKGFKNDAKVNFLEYADRMQKAGKVDEAFRALKEFADLCPDQDEIRLMLADQLTKADRKDEAIEQLQTLYERYDLEGRGTEASATAERIRAIDPTVEPRSADGGRRKSTAADLVFLDLDAPSPRASRQMSSIPEPPPRASAPVVVTPPFEEPIVTSETPTVTRESPIATPASQADTPIAGITRIDDDAVKIETTPSESIFGLESTHVGDDASGRSNTTSGSLLGVEPTSFGELATPPASRPSVPTPTAHGHLGSDLDFVMPPPEPTPAPSSPTIDFDLSELATPAAALPTSPARPTPNTTRIALEGLPVMDLEVPVPPTPRASKPVEALSLSNDLELIEPALDSSTTEEVLVDLHAESLTLDDDPRAVPTPPISRPSTSMAAASVEVLKGSVERAPENWGLRRELAEAMLDAGSRDSGIKELESAMLGAERSGDLDLASSVAEEIARLEPETVRHHQKRVEYAFRTNDRARLIEAYLSLGDALLRADQGEKARSIYQRVIDLAPDELRAKAAMETIAVPAPEPPPPVRPTVPGHRRSSTVKPIPEVAPQAPADDSYVNLGDWLRDAEGPKDTRMVVAEQEPSGDEQADFADMLKKFKQGVAENVDAEDYQSHYDLAIAFKEMGLLDEAIAEFQKALGSPTNRVPTYEALGQCFIDKGQFKLAGSILSRALSERSSDDQLVGVLYLLGRAAEAQGNGDDALGYYQRVFMTDIQFRDIADRISDLERAAR